MSSSIFLLIDYSFQIKVMAYFEIRACHPAYWYRYKGSLFCCSSHLHLALYVHYFVHCSRLPQQSSADDVWLLLHDVLFCEVLRHAVFSSASLFSLGKLWREQWKFGCGWNGCGGRFGGSEDCKTVCISGVAHPCMLQWTSLLPASSPSPKPCLLPLLHPASLSLWFIFHPTPSKTQTTY